MDEFHQEENHAEAAPKSTVFHAARWPAIVAILVLGAAAAAFSYVHEERLAMNQLSSHDQELAAQNQQLNATLAQVRGQMDTLTSKLEQMSTPAHGAASASASPARPAHTAARRSPVRRPSADEQRIAKLQAEVDAQGKQLEETQAAVAGNRTDIEGKLGSTRDELNGSIAKNHDELVALEKRGERLYFEFDLNKSKQFQKAGPLDLSLRKADTKHQTYDLTMLVDDHQLPKKKVVLYEPIWLHEGDDPQPVQIVVNKIGKNYVHGYVSAPKYRASELATASASSPATTASPAPTAPAPARPAVPIKQQPQR